MNEELIMRIAKRIPSKIRKNVIDEDLITKANYASDVVGTPMEYLFDVYEMFIDSRGDHDDWNCTKCRAYILEQWKMLKPYLEQIYNEDS